jgi:tRNA(Arg) A34 adenosine deaminase TadA
MSEQPPSITFSLPAWIHGFVQNVTVIRNLDDRVSFVIEASRRNISEKTGGPFAAAVFEKDTGRLVSLGVNLIEKEQLSILHAEIIAITLAQRKVGTFDLGAHGLPCHELITSTEPCAMCLGAIPWSGVVRVVASARDADARRIGFDEGPKPGNWRAALAQRGIEVICDVRRKKAAAVLAEYSRNGGLVYNSRGACCQARAEESDSAKGRKNP